MDSKLQEIAERVRNMRELTEISSADMARALGMTEADYLACESGEVDLTFTFLHKCAQEFGIDITLLLSGESPTLSGYTVTREGEGLPLSRRAGFRYLHLAYLFKRKIAEPFVVEAPYLEQEQNEEIKTSVHKGQEMDYILSGSMKFVHGGRTEILHSGDCVYYDSGKPHGMIATGGAPCRFLAVVIKE